MDEFTKRHQVRALFGRQGPVIHIRDFAGAGVSLSVVRRMSADGELARLSKSAFVVSAAFQNLPPWEKFRQRSLAFGLCAGPMTHLTGWAAAMLWKLPVLGRPPAFPTGLRPGDAHRAPSVTPHGRIRWGHLPTAHRAECAGVVVDAAYAVVDVARHFGRVAGLLAADVALARGSLREVMTRLCTDMARYPGIGDARWVTARADSRSESPVETLGRWAFLRAGRPAPLSNWWVGCSGRWFRVDHLLPEQLVVLEADGAVKYDNRSDASQVVRDEKERERLLRAAGFGVVRYDHALALRQPQELLRRTDVEAALRIGRPVSATWQQNSPWG